MHTAEHNHYLVQRLFSNHLDTHADVAYFLNLDAAIEAANLYDLARVMKVKTTEYGFHYTTDEVVYVTANRSNN